MISQSTGFISSGIGKSNAEFSWQTNAFKRLALLDSASNLASIFSNSQDTEGYIAALGALNETDKNLSNNMLMADIMRTINETMHESLKKQLKEKIKDTFTIG